jgi:hypothetical protein
MFPDNQPPVGVPAVRPAENEDETRFVSLSSGITVNRNPDS